MGPLSTEYLWPKVPPYNGHARPWWSKSPSVSTPIKQKNKQGNARGTREVRAQNFLHSFPLSGTPVVLSHWAWILGPAGLRKLRTVSGTLVVWFGRILTVIFLEDFSGHFLPQKSARKGFDETNLRKTNSGGSKIRIRETSVLPRTGPKNCLRSPLRLSPLS